MLKNWKFPFGLRTTDVDDTPVDGATTAPISSNWANDHTTDIDAHMSDIWQTLRTGEYYNPLPITGNGEVALVANQLYGFIYPVIRSITFDRIRTYVATLAAGKFVRLGIYNTGTNLHPGTLLLDGGAVSVGAAGVVTVTISQQLTKGIYFLAFVSDGTPGIQFLSGRTTPLGISSTYIWTPKEYWYVAQAYGALPTTFPTATLLDDGGSYIGAIDMRVLSLD